MSGSEAQGSPPLENQKYKRSLETMDTKEIHLHWIFLMEGGAIMEEWTSPFHSRGPLRNIDEHFSVGLVE